MEDKKFILNLLNMANSLLKGNTTELDTSIATFNSVTLTAEQILKIQTTIISFIDKNEIIPYDTLQLTIEALNSINKKYLLSLLKLTLLQSSNADASKLMINDMLDDTSIVFDNNNDRYSYYYALSNYAINLKDVILIEKAINSVQNL